MRLATLPYCEQCWFASDTTVMWSVKFALYSIEIPLAVATTESEIDRFTVELSEEGDGGLLRLAWGRAEWTARFTLGQSIHNTP
ncbi:MAG: hypothetical protein IIC57_06540 [Proteobacteria bacterium]|nr:hypothetical protein [Pseudomonadota bacterium]